MCSHGIPLGRTFSVMQNIGFSGRGMQRGLKRQLLSKLKETTRIRCRLDVFLVLTFGTSFVPVA
jgi:hypothetical protein